MNAVSPSSLQTLPGLQALLDASPFHALLPIELIRRDAGERSLELHLPYAPRYQRQPDSGRYHGGVIVTLCDVAGAFAMMAVTGSNGATAALQINYLRPPALHSDLRATARVRQAGRTLGLVDVEVKDAEQRLVAIARVSIGTAQSETRGGDD